MNTLNSPSSPIYSLNQPISSPRAEFAAYGESQSCCPGCGLWNSQLVSHLRNVPINCSALWSTDSEARNCTTGSIELRGCDRCGLVFNALFDNDRIVYDTKYDNSLDFSAAFQSYIDELSSRLAGTYQLEDRRIVEIGCGNGTFLKAMCRKAKATGIGYDPSYTGELSPPESVRFSLGYFDAPEAKRGFDFLTCRHVLEHFPDPLEFLQHLLNISAGSPGATFYFEVPNGSFVLGGNGLWDVIYPHVSYFTESSLRALFERAGFEVLQAGKAFEDQFLFIEARRSPATPNENITYLDDGKSSLSGEITSFTAHFDRAVRDWTVCLERLSAIGEPFAFWGAGAKGVTFLNLVPGARNIANVVDSNVRKQQMFVPGTGQRVIGPETLREVSPSTVILLNAAYQQEVQSVLATQGVTAKIVSEPNFTV